jgi:hypothetical protein
VKTTNNHVERDLESREDVQTPPSPNIAPEFAHHDGDEVLRCPGAKWHHTPAVLVVYSEDKTVSHKTEYQISTDYSSFIQLLAF